MEHKNKLSINHWALEDRPREKMIARGVNALSDAELLAILIGSGNRDETAVQLMQRVLHEYNDNLNDLAKCELSDLNVFKGMGNAKSITIMAALELGKRRNLQRLNDRAAVSCSKDIYAIFQPRLCDLYCEEFWLLTLNQANLVITQHCISSGGMDATYVDIRKVLRFALLDKATSIAIVHNHPSGKVHPSNDDKKVTRSIINAASMMNIRMLDHLVVAEKSYFSFADEGLM